MTPQLAGPNTRNSCLGHAKGVCDVLLCHPISKKLSNGCHLGSSENDAASSLANGLAPLGNAVGNVLLLRSKEKMIWPNTAPNVASVAHADICWDLSVGQCPGHAVSPRTTPADHELAISGWHSIASPQPAPVCLPGVSPESFAYVHGLWRHSIIVTHDACV